MVFIFRQNSLPAINMGAEIIGSDPANSFATFFANECVPLVLVRVMAIIPVDHIFIVFTIKLIQFQLIIRPRLFIT